MCGRFSLFVPPGALEERFDAAFAYDFAPTYNAAPGQDLPVVTDAAPESIRSLNWGFVPAWADDRSDFEFINARAETVAEKPTFSGAFEQEAESGEADESDGPQVGRCLVLADGFYEWTQGEAGKRPYRVTLVDGEPFAMAGLWARWRPPRTQTGLGDFGGGGEPDAEPEVAETFAVITTEPNDVVADLHHRMAVVLDPDEESTWLSADPETAASLLDPYPGEEMRVYPVSTAVNDPSNDSPALVEEVEGGA